MAALAQISFITGIMCANLSAKDQRQGLLCLILTFAPQDHRRKTPNCGHCASDAGAISVGVVVSLEESFVGGGRIATHASISSGTVSLLSLSGANY